MRSSHGVTSGASLARREILRPRPPQKSASAAGGRAHRGRKASLSGHFSHGDADAQPRTPEAPIFSASRRDPLTALPLGPSSGGRAALWLDRFVALGEAEGNARVAVFSGSQVAHHHRAARVSKSTSRR
jgi:hypothetical protein